MATPAVSMWLCSESQNEATRDATVPMLSSMTETSSGTASDDSVCVGGVSAGGGGLCSGC